MAIRGRTPHQHSQGLTKHLLCARTLEVPIRGPRQLGKGLQSRGRGPSPRVPRAQKATPGAARLCPGLGAPGWRGHSHLALPLRGSRSQTRLAPGGRFLPTPAASAPASASHANEPPALRCPSRAWRGSGCEEGPWAPLTRGPCTQTEVQTAPRPVPTAQGPLSARGLARSLSAPQSACARLEGCQELGGAGRTPDPGALLTAPCSPPGLTHAQPKSISIRWTPAMGPVTALGGV